MEDNKCIQKCGEILMDIKSKNKKNKIYIFQCTFCDIQCDQLKKFSLHIGEEHLDDFDEILNEAENVKETEIPKGTEFLKDTELKVEAESEEIKMPSFNNIEEAPDIKVFESPIETKANVNPDPLDTFNAGSSCAHTDNLNCEIKYEIIDNEDQDHNELGVMDGTVSISDSDKSDSDEEYIEVPHKKRKTNKIVKKGKQTKRKENESNETGSEDSKDAECNGGRNRSTPAEKQKRYRAKLKQDQERYKEYLAKEKERMNKRIKRCDMPPMMLLFQREKHKLYQRQRRHKNSASCCYIQT